MLVKFCYNLFKVVFDYLIFVLYFVWKIIVFGIFEICVDKVIYLGKNFFLFRINF